MQNHYSFQIDFRPAPTPVYGCKHYREHRETLETIDDILTRSGLDHTMIELALKKRRETIPQEQDRLGDLNQFIRHTLTAWRVRILLPLLKATSLREIEKDLAANGLHQWFCHIGNFGLVKPPSKSTIDRYKNWFELEDIKAASNILVRKAASDPGNYDPELESAVNLLGFEFPSSLTEVWFDSTCLKPNIHFPVDWVMLTDCVKTLMKAVSNIRKHGLLNRMAADGPATFLRNVNQISINMSNCRRQKNSKNKRKKIFRELKALTKTVTLHATRHKALLLENLNRSDLSEAQARCIITRIDGVLQKLPQAIRQANERIIGERKVESKDKLHSIYEPDTQIIVRGKSGAEVEFGNKLHIVENREGLILGWNLQKNLKSDARELENLIILTEENTEETITKMCGDRGYVSKREQARVGKSRPEIKDHITPKNPFELRDKMKDSEFRDSQKRRAQTEGRIGIIKNVYLSGRSLSKGLESRRQEMSWIMLAHNLNKLAQKRISEQKAREKKRKILELTA